MVASVLQQIIVVTLLLQVVLASSGLHGKGLQDPPPLADVLVADGARPAANYAELKHSAAGDGVALNTPGPIQT